MFKKLNKRFYQLYAWRVIHAGCKRCMLLQCQCQNTRSGKLVAPFAYWGSQFTSKADVVKLAERASTSTLKYRH